MTIRNYTDNDNFITWNALKHLHSATRHQNLAWDSTVFYDVFDKVYKFHNERETQRLSGTKANEHAHPLLIIVETGKKNIVGVLGGHSLQGLAAEEPSLASKFPPNSYYVRELFANPSSRDGTSLALLNEATKFSKANGYTSMVIRSPLLGEKVKPAETDEERNTEFHKNENRVADFRNWLIGQGFGKLFTDREQTPAMRYFIRPPVERPTETQPKV